MSEAAGSRSLEDILASIRQSLADENVDGLVKLSAAAAAAARAEVGEEASRHLELATALALPEAAEDDPLKDKLMGALAAEPDAVEDVSMAETPADPGDDALDAEPVDPAALSKLWFLRPGAAEETATSQSASPALSIDPFAGRGGTEAASDVTAAAIFALSARAIVGDSPAPHVPAPVSQPAADAAGGKLQAPRLDASQIEMINKLKASSAAAVESIASDEEIVDLRTPVWPPKPQPAQVADVAKPAAPKTAEAKPDVIEAEPARLDAAKEQPVAPAAPVAEAPKPEAVKADDPNVLPASLLTLPSRSTPLFVSANEKSRPIVSAPPLATGPAMLLADDAGDEEPVIAKKESPPVEAPAVEMPTVEVEEATVIAAKAHEADLDDVLAPVAEHQPDKPSRLTDALDQTGAPVEDDVTDNIHTLKTVAVPVAPDAEPEMVATTASPALEQMIAAVLEPVLHRLLENNLGPTIEAMVRREVEKALEARRDA